MMKKKLILISGSPCVGKTTVGEKPFEEMKKQIDSAGNETNH